MELIKLEVRIIGGNWFDITENIFEKSVYSTLTSYTGITPSKACSLYYEHGENRICGLNYTPPSANDTKINAFKAILADAIGIENQAEIRFNNIQFHISYRTKDSLRISQFRPDLHTFFKNSSIEEYPHHEQFYGQQDKIVDSERFSANLWGQLIRVWKAIYQRQEYATAESEKESGDLVEINGEPYYVTAVENEYYPNAIYQKVTYSKNFNQLSQIVTIPSEPRFYEVSERSMIRREVRMNDFLLLTTQPPVETKRLHYANTLSWCNFVQNVVFRENEPILPNYAYTHFKGDKKRSHNGINSEKLFPYSGVSVSLVGGVNTIRPQDNVGSASVIVPLQHFPMKNSIVFEWDMEDNFKAGDCIDSSINGNNDTTDEAFFALQSVRYCDIMGRADLCGFRLFNKTDWSLEQSQRLPYATDIDFVPSEGESIFYLPNNQYIVLDKDNREAISFNYQINLLQDSPEFITYSNVFGTKASKLKMCFLKTTIPYLDETVMLNNATILVDNVGYKLSRENSALMLSIDERSCLGVKAIVLYEEDGNQKIPCIVRNIESCNNKFDNWYFAPIF